MSKKDGAPTPPLPDETAALVPSEDGGLASRGDDQTMGPPPSEPVAKAHEKSAAKFFSRYELLELVGTGGMGRVYKAADPTLGRLVALKLLRSSGGEVEHLLQEARSQAKVDHPNLCKVYEAGTFEGEPYIAMQYIEGQTLGLAGASMSIEQRVEVLRLIAEALHAAHRQGLIHRDMKPGNVMVSRDEAGAWTPFVMDFGLAHLDDSNKTVEGSVLGTPSFMAPEQARGETGRADRRTDVYGLGATLYHLLTGRPPFEGESLPVVLLKVIQEDPVPPRVHDPSLPRDLETIVLKCLAKEPQQRYDSARALAEDLRRYLDGEPVEARRAGIPYRLWKKALKYKVAAAALALALVALVAGGGAAVRESVMAGRRERLASRFAEVGRDMEAVMERERLLPLHDLRTAKGIVGAKMASIRQDMSESGAIAQGSGHYALGKGYLALGEFSQARRELQDAIGKYDCRERGAAFALGLALVELYRIELSAAQRIQNADARRERMAIVDSALRKPALRYLKEGASEGSSPQYAQALLAFLDGDYSAAVAKAGEAERKSPWLYGASLLAGDAWVQVGDARRDTGARAEARQAYDNAERLYRAGILKGGSDPRGYEGIAQLRLSEMYMDLIQTGRPLKESFEEAERACKDALAADPENAAAYSLLSQARWRWGQDQAQRGDDPAPTYREAIWAAEKAIALDPLDERTHKALGDSLYLSALHEYNYNRATMPLLKRAVAAYREALRLNPSNPATNSNLGNAFHLMASVPENPTAQSILGYRKQAESAFREAIRLAPKESDYWNNLASGLLCQGQDRAERGEDPSALFDEAIRDCDEALRLNPGNTSAINNLGYTSLLAGEFEWERLGRDPRPRYDRAETSYRAILKRNPDNVIALRNLGDTLGARAKYEDTEKLPSQGSLDRSREAYQAALSANPVDPDSWLGLARVTLYEAEQKRNRKVSLDDTLKRAEASLLKAEALSEESYLLHLTRSQFEYLRGQRDMASGRSPLAAYRASEAAADKAIALVPDDPTLYQTRAEASLGRAEWLAERKSPGALTAIGQGERAAKKAVELSKTADRSEGVLATLLELDARLQSDPARREALRAEARSHLARALKEAPNLAKEFGSLQKRLGP